MPSLVANGLSCYYELHGQGEPLVLIHGLGGDSAFWDGSLSALAPHFQLVVYDLRGSGRTLAVDTPYSMALLADDLAALLTALRIEQAHVLGFSLGGNVALAFARQYPERVSKLVLAATFATMNRQARLFLDAVLDTYAQSGSARLVFNLVAPWLFSPEFLAQAAHAEFFRYSSDEPHPQPFSAWHHQYRAQQQFDLRADLLAIQAPALVLGGAQDRLAHPEDATLLARHLPNARLDLLPGAGHLFHYEQPAWFHQHVLAFLSPEPAFHPMYDCAALP